MNNTIDLQNKKYSRQELKDNIYNVKLLDILQTQQIDATFAVRYILNSNYQLHKEDENITQEDVCKYQPHISKRELQKQFILYDTDDDSIIDFETISNK